MKIQIVEVERNQLAFDDLKFSQKDLNSSQFGDVLDRLNVALEHVCNIQQHASSEELQELLEDCESNLEEAISETIYDSKRTNKLKSNKNKQFSKVVNETYLVFRPLQDIQKVIPQLQELLKKENLNVVFLSEIES